MILFFTQENTPWLQLHILRTAPVIKKYFVLCNRAQHFLLIVLQSQLFFLKYQSLIFFHFLFEKFLIFDLGLLIS